MSVRAQIEVEEMMGRFSAITVDDDDRAIGVQEALRWVMFPEIGNESLLENLPG